MTENLTADWVPTACTLPTAARPVRTAEFDDLFRDAVSGVSRPAPGEVRLSLHASPANAGRAAQLAARETGCCSFFRFALTIADGELALTVTADPTHEHILTAFAAHAGTEAGVTA
ncbi:hypothetical protein [Nocardioides sp.]|uniref:hypothetical protein n=1 Tax=Nocardioides sp. TaxID=35761 RepID=UPI0027330053|nr:hypothetical protein [Nocardioides sp.]MDP3890383.1 hypothetical protein [Nocardioides sp.]